MILYFLVGFILVAAILYLKWELLAGKQADILVEAFGFALDILLFGIIFSVYDWWREHGRLIQKYQEELDDLKYWKSDDCIRRKVSIIKRLDKMQALPSMAEIELSGDINLKDVNFEGANLSYANLKLANLNSGQLNGATLVGACLDGTRFRNAQISNARLDRAELRKAELYRADLSFTNLTGACLDEAHLEGADLEGAVLQGAKLVQAHLQETVLIGADFRDADLKGANFEGAKLGSSIHAQRARFNGANLNGTILFGLDLRRTEGLTYEQVKDALWNDSTKFPYHVKNEIKEPALMNPKDKPSKENDQTRED